MVFSGADAWTGDTVPAGTDVLTAGRGQHAIVFCTEDAGLTELVSDLLLQSVLGDRVAIAFATSDRRRSVEAHLTAWMPIWQRRRGS
jgi:hypothetical protein